MFWIPPLLLWKVSATHSGFSNELIGLNDRGNKGKGPHCKAFKANSHKCTPYGRYLILPSSSCLILPTENENENEISQSPAVSESDLQVEIVLVDEGKTADDGENLGDKAKPITKRTYDKKILIFVGVVAALFVGCTIGAFVFLNQLKDKKEVRETIFGFAMGYTSAAALMVGSNPPMPQRQPPVSAPPPQQFIPPHTTFPSELALGKRIVSVLIRMSNYLMKLGFLTSWATSITYICMLRADQWSVEHIPPLSPIVISMSVMLGSAAVAWGLEIWLDRN